MTRTPQARDASSEGPMAVAYLDATAVGKRFGRKVVLNGASVSVRAGEAVALVGENGAGKSTLLRICAGLLAPDSGNVTARSRVGYCPQEPGLVDLVTTDEHLALFAPGLGLTREQAARDGRTLLSELAFPAEDRSQARHLSGGARQKLNLALALLGEARVLLLDEPYQGFDHGSYVSFWQHVERWKAEGRAILIVTHLLADTTLVDTVVELARRHRLDWRRHTRRHRLRPRPARSRRLCHAPTRRQHDPTAGPRLTNPPAGCARIPEPAARAGANRPS